MSFSKSRHRQVGIAEKIAHPVQHFRFESLFMLSVVWLVSPLFVVGLGYELGFVPPVVGPEPLVFMWIATHQQTEDEQQDIGSVLQELEEALNSQEDEQPDDHQRDEQPDLETIVEQQGDQELEPLFDHQEDEQQTDAEVEYDCLGYPVTDDGTDDREDRRPPEPDTRSLDDVHPPRPKE